MSPKEKPLPKPPNTPFGRKRKFESEEKEPPLMADRMAMAMTEGKLDEFLQKEMPDNEHARKLAEMMMGMTGMMPSGGFSGAPEINKTKSTGNKGAKRSSREDSPEKPLSNEQPPEDVVNAVKAGDVSALVGMLQREHKKRSPGKDDGDIKEEKKDGSSSTSSASVEKAVVEQMIRIASENNISPDWILFRALKRYVEEYKKTGNL